MELLHPLEALKFALFGKPTLIGFPELRGMNIVTVAVIASELVYYILFPHNYILFPHKSSTLSKPIDCYWLKNMTTSRQPSVDHDVHFVFAPRRPHRRGTIIGF